MCIIIRCMFETYSHCNMLLPVTIKSMESSRIMIIMLEGKRCLKIRTFMKAAVSVGTNMSVVRSYPALIYWNNKTTHRAMNFVSVYLAYSMLALTVLTLSSLILCQKPKLKEVLPHIEHVSVQHAVIAVMKTSKKFFIHVGKLCFPVCDFVYHAEHTLNFRC